MPVVIKSDNGPPFQSHEFKEYCLKNGIIHKKICPLWPEANGTTEKFMQVINKIIQCAEMEGSNWRHELNMALLNYRASPHCSTKIPPATLFLGRKIRTILPALPTKFHNENDGKARENDSANKQKWKQYADKDRSTRPHNLKLGDILMVEQNQNNSLMSKFDPAPRTVTFVKGDLITATRGDGHEISRNSSFFKKMQKGVKCDAGNQNVDEDSWVIGKLSSQRSGGTRTASLARPIPVDILDTTAVPRRSNRDRSIRSTLNIGSSSGTSYV